MVEEFVKRFPKADETYVLDHLKALKYAFRRFYKVEIPSSQFRQRYELGDSVCGILEDNKDVWERLLLDNMGNYVSMSARTTMATHRHLVKKDSLFDKPIPDLGSVLFYGTRMANKANEAKLDQLDKYAIHSRLTSGIESFVHHCVQTRNSKALALLQKTFDHDMNEEGYRVAWDACIRYVLFDQLYKPTLTMKWLRRLWANFFKRLGSESIDCENKIEEFAVDFFRELKSVPDNAICKDLRTNWKKRLREQPEEKLQRRETQTTPELVGQKILWKGKKGTPNLPGTITGRTKRGYTITFDDNEYSDTTVPEYKAQGLKENYLATL